jgi:hypothetical protein
MGKESTGDRSQDVRAGSETPGEPKLRGFSAADDPKRANGTSVDVGPDDAEPATPEVVATEDTFIAPPGKIDHNGPPKDPNAPSGSLSSDDAEVLAVDFGVANPTHPNM